MIGRFPFLVKALQCACLIQHFVSCMAEAQLVTEPARMMCRCCRCSNCVLLSVKTYAVRRMVGVQQHKVCEPVCAHAEVCARSWVLPWQPLAGLLLMHCTARVYELAWAAALCCVFV